MAYQLSTIAGQVRNRIRDSAYDPGQTTDAINDTLNDVFNEYRLPFMETRQAYTTVANVADITNGVGLPTDYVQAIDLYVTSTHQVIPYVGSDNADDAIYDDSIVTTNVDGLSWSMYGLTPFLLPVPTISYNVTLRYYKKPTILVNDTDVPPLPSQYQELLVAGAAYRILQVKDNYDQAAVQQNKYDEILAKLVMQFSQNQVGYPTQMPINKISVGKRNF